MGNVVNVSASKPAVGGAIHSALVSAGKTLPTSTTTAVTGFDDLGFVSEDGVTNSNNPSSNNIKAWGGQNVLNTQQEKADTFKFKLIEVLNQDVLKTVYATGNVSESSGEIVIKANATELEARMWIVDMIMREGKKKRICIPNGKISEIGDIVYKDNEAVGYDLTIQAFPDATGNTHYEYIK